MDTTEQALEQYKNKDLAWVPATEEAKAKCYDWYYSRLRGETVTAIAKASDKSREYVSRAIKWAALDLSKSSLDRKGAAQFFEDKVMAGSAILEGKLNKMLAAEEAIDNAPRDDNGNFTPEGEAIYKKHCNNLPSVKDDLVPLVREMRAHYKLASEIKGVKQPEGGKNAGPTNVQVILPGVTMKDPEDRGDVIEADAEVVEG
tara:strand:+ start:97 stop:702 length:606 start_codon:yes stop_codon:yes gene_type:complete